MSASIAHDFLPVRTADGSFTLRSEMLDEQYHSLHGAAQESMHVFVQAGLLASGLKRIDLLEVGLGTGLNALLTWIEAGRAGIAVNYHAIEPHPLPLDVLRAIDHPAQIGAQEKASCYFKMMSVTEPFDLDRGFRFTPHHRTLVSSFLGAFTDPFDLVYFDAFAPKKQPDLWTEDVFKGLFRAMRPGGRLVTYCARGEVRRAMERSGFSMERLPGPPGKREMLRASRPS